MKRIASKVILITILSSTVLSGCFEGHISNTSKVINPIAIAPEPLKLDGLGETTIKFNHVIALYPDRIPLPPKLSLFRRMLLNTPIGFLFYPLWFAENLIVTFAERGVLLFNPLSLKEAFDARGISPAFSKIQSLRATRLKITMVDEDPDSDIDLSKFISYMDIRLAPIDAALPPKQLECLREEREAIYSWIFENKKCGREHYASCPVSPELVDLEKFGVEVEKEREVLESELECLDGKVAQFFEISQSKSGKLKNQSSPTTQRGVSFCNPSELSSFQAQITSLDPQSEQWSDAIFQLQKEREEANRLRDQFSDFFKDGILSIEEVRNQIRESYKICDKKVGQVLYPVVHPLEVSKTSDIEFPKYVLLDDEDPECAGAVSAQKSKKYSDMSAFLAKKPYCEISRTTPDGIEIQELPPGVNSMTFQPVENLNIADLIIRKDANGVPYGMPQVRVVATTKLKARPRKFFSLKNFFAPLQQKIWFQGEIGLDVEVPLSALSEIK